MPFTGIVAVQFAERFFSVRIPEKPDRT